MLYLIFGQKKRNVHLERRYDVDYDFYCFQDDELLTPVVDKHGVTDYWVCGKCWSMYDISVKDDIDQEMIGYAGEA